MGTTGTWRLDLITVTPSAWLDFQRALQTQSSPEWTVRCYGWRDGQVPISPAPDLVMVGGLDGASATHVATGDGALQAHLQIRAWCTAQSIPLVILYGNVQQQLQGATDALQRHVTSRTSAPQDVCDWHWNCEGCSDPACERRLFTALMQPL